MNSSPAGEHHAPLTTHHSPLVALVGNPNTGKTTLFNALAGMQPARRQLSRRHRRDQEGARCTSRGQTLDLIDLPGTYSLAARSPDEMVAVDVILGQQPGEPRPDVVVSIVDASNLERNLYLTTQVLELGVPVVVALNMIDVAEGQGLQDRRRASCAEQLGVPVVPIQANKGKGLDELKTSADRRPPMRARLPRRPALSRSVRARSRASCAGGSATRRRAFLVRRLLLDVGGYTEQRLVSRQHGSRPCRRTVRPPGSG